MESIAKRFGLIWFTHAIALFTHEYAHTFTAWLLQQKENPFALDYGHLSLSNLLLLHQVDDNVDYRTIFLHGHGREAALIAFAGAGFGNALLYLLSRLWMHWKRPYNTALFSMFFFWLTFMCVGNFYDYVPIRTFASHGDIAIIARGLNISPWIILFTLGCPTAWTMWHFFTKCLPRAIPRSSHGSEIQGADLVITCAIIMFSYFGASGLTGYGASSRTLSIGSIVATFGVTAACWPSRKWMRTIAAPSVSNQAT